METDTQEIAAGIEGESRNKRDQAVSQIRDALKEEEVRFIELSPSDAKAPHYFMMNYSCARCTLAVELIVQDTYVSFKVNEYVRFRCEDVNELRLLRLLNELNVIYRYVVFTFEAEDNKGDICAASTIDINGEFDVGQVLRRRNGMIEICDDEYQKLMRNVLGCSNVKVDDPNSTFPMHQ
jgi:hypothetical protein